MKACLVILVALISLTALFSGIALIARPDGSLLGLPLSLIEPTPFRDFLVPGIILGGAVGGLNLVALVLLLGRHPSRLGWTFAGGVTLVLWLIVQLLLINEFHLLHLAYFFAGGLVILMSYQLKGRWLV